MKEKASNDMDHSNVVCINCGNTLREAWKYCPYCKDRIDTITCRQCGEEISSQWQFCPYCQNRVSEGEVTERAFNDSNEWLREVLRIKN